MDYIEIENISRQYFENEPSGHDFKHIANVLDYAMQLQKVEGGDFDVIYVAALFHDVHRVLSSKEGHFIPAEDAMDEVKRILSTLDIEEDILDDILYVIREHDNKAEDDIDMPIELKIIQDADILDALGERALSRTYTYCKKHNIPVSNNNVPLDSVDFIPDVHPISMTHYVYRVLIPQRDILHTDTARRLADQDMQVLYDFVKNNTK